MKKRLRKKLHVGEFQALGFEVRGRRTPAIDPADDDVLLDDLIAFVESYGLRMGGSVSPRIGFYVDRGRRSCTDEDRDALAAFLGARTEVATVDVAPLSDARYPDEPRRRR